MSEVSLYALHDKGDGGAYSAVVLVTSLFDHSLHGSVGRAHA